MLVLVSTGAPGQCVCVLFSKAFKEFALLTEWLHAREILVFEQVGTIMIEFFAEAVNLIGGEKFGQY